ncbi:MAG: hypothetical protein U9R74_20095 [Pseudomonadota bacterium]|nr:hypothetical protein [Pseudomonadota bacterium]
MAKGLLASMLVFPLGHAQAAVEGRPCAADPGNAPVQYGDLITCKIEVVGETDVFRFMGTSGEHILVQAARQTDEKGTPCVRLLRPDGTQMRSRCASFGVQHHVRLDQSGKHAMIVSERLNDGTLGYILVLDRVAPTSPTSTAVNPGVIVSDMIAPNGDIDLFSFQGQAGDTASIQVTRQTDEAGTPCAKLFGPDGTQLRSRCASFGVRYDIQLDQSGEYTIAVSERLNDGELNYRLEYQCSAGVCPSLDRPGRYSGVTYLPDINSNGKGEVVALIQERNAPLSTHAVIKDGETGADIKAIPVLKENFDPIGIANVGDLNSDAVPELAVLAVNLDTHSVVVSIVDPVSAEILSSREIFDSEWTPIGLTMVPDLNGDSIAEFGVLAVDRNHVATLRIQDPISGVILKDISSKKKN